MAKKKLAIFIKKYYFPLILIFFTAYVLLLIYNSSFAIEGKRYFSLFDDMMISMRYGYNLAHGYGLIWNPGLDKIEGFSNPLWTLYMSLLHLLPIPIEKTSLLIQLTGLLASLGILYFVKEITAIITRNSRFAITASLIFTAFYFPLINWSIIQGTEVSIFTLLLSACAYLIIKSFHNRKFYFITFLLMGIGTWVRLDFGVSAIILIILYLTYASKHRLKIIFIGLPIFLIFPLAQIGLRWIYYNDILPNTYYLKMTGYPVLQRITRGFYFTLKELNPIFIFIPFIYAYITKNRDIIILLSIFSAQIFYSIYVGADAWEQFGGTNRYVAPSVPFLFIMLATILNSTRLYIKKVHLTKFAQYKKIEIAILALFFILLNSSSDNMLIYLMQIKPFPTKHENAFQVRLSKALNEITLPRAKIGIVQAGVVPYFSPDRIYVDLLGKNDKFIARSASHERADTGRPLQKYISFWPGHTKWDYKYIVNEVKPDIFGQIFPSSEITRLNKNYNKHITKEGFVFYLRN